MAYTFIFSIFDITNDYTLLTFSTEIYLDGQPVYSQPELFVISASDSESGSDKKSLHRL